VFRAILKKVGEIFMRLRFYLLVFCLIFAVGAVSAQKGKAAAQAASRSITLITQPNATVWLRGVNYGTTDESGKLLIRLIPAGAHELRVRADGFKEVTQNLTAAQKGEVKIPLTEKADEAELAFQEAERASAREKEKARELYKKAIQLRPKFFEAHIGLARVLADEGFSEEAHKTIAQARKLRLANAEASAVEGRIYKLKGDKEKAVEAFKRSIREGKGFQPEAHTGLALLYQEKAEEAVTMGDFQEEEINYKEAAKWFAPAVKQLGASPDAIVIFQLYGVVYEKMNRPKDAIKIYEDFLKIFPDTIESTAVRSFIVQLKKQMSEQPQP
jgi:tetratricopeptide (TPR) repeat protein